MSIGYSPNSPKSSHIVGLSNITYEELIPLLKTITIGTKDGSFFVRSGFIDPTTGRKTNSSVEPTAQILIIDGDSTIDPVTGEITEGAPDPQLVAAVLKNAGWSFIIYRSHSHGKKGHRYRIVMWCNRPYIQAELGPTLDSVINELHDAGIYLRNAPENMNWSLAWYLPRRDASDTNQFTYIEYQGAPVAVVEAEQMSEQIQSAISSAREKRSNPLGNGLIRVFNELNSLPELLKQRGDTEKSYNRLIWSGSSSGTPGIVIFDDLMYSHHADDPLADGEAHDAFDVYRLTNNKSLTQGLASLSAQQILDYIANCNDDEILEDINRGLAFVSPQIQAKVRKVLKTRLELSISTLKEEAKYFKKNFEDEHAEEEFDSHFEIVEDFLTQYAIAPISYAGQIYVYDGKIWKAEEVDDFNNRFAERYKTNPLCKRSQDYAALSKLLYITCNKEKDFFEEAPYGLAVNGKFIQVQEDGSIHESILTSDHRQRIHYNFPIEEDVPVKWLDTLDKTFDTQLEKDLLQEIFAATLFGLFPNLKKSALFKGTGDSGKTTIQTVLQEFIPEALQSASAPCDWGNKEYIGNIAGKALNSVGEMDDKRKMSGNEFKKVIGNDKCEGRKLYLGVFNFRNTAAHIFNANEFPPTTATDKAFFSRWLILEFKYSIPEKDRIENFAHILLSEEKPQILNWILQGAQRLIVNKKFTRTLDHEKLIKLWESTVNPFLAFIQDTNHIEIVKNPMAIPAARRIYYSAEQIYKLYELWCRVNNVKGTFAVHKLIQKMRDHHIIAQNPNNNMYKYWTGIILHTDFSYTSKVSVFDADGIYQNDYKGNRI